jgi:hypothetical protein
MGQSDIVPRVGAHEGANVIKVARIIRRMNWPLLFRKFRSMILA